MLDRRWVQAGGVAGILGFLFEAATLPTDSAVSNSASDAQITAYFTNHRTDILVQTILTVVGSAIIFWFVGTLARLLHERDEQSPLGLIVLASGAGMTVVMAITGVTLTALAFVTKQGALPDPSVVRVFYEIENGILMPGVFGCIAAIFLAALGVAMIRRAFAAPWAGWLSLLVAVLSIVGGIVGLSSVDGGTSIIGFFPALAVVLMVVISSIFMLRDRAASYSDNSDAELARTDRSRIAPAS